MHRKSKLEIWSHHSNKKTKYNNNFLLLLFLMMLYHLISHYLFNLPYEKQTLKWFKERVADHKYFPHFHFQNFNTSVLLVYFVRYRHFTQKHHNNTMSSYSAPPAASSSPHVVVGTPWTTPTKKKENAAFKKQLYREAVNFHNQVIQLDPSCTNISAAKAAAMISNRSPCNMKLCHYEEALDDAKKKNTISFRPAWCRGFIKEPLPLPITWSTRMVSKKDWSFVREALKLERNGDETKELLKEFEALELQQTHSQEELKQKGNIFFKDNDYQKAIDTYNLAIEKEPECEAAAAIYSNRSGCYFKLDNYELAFGDGSAVVALRPDWCRWYFRRGAACETLKKWEDGLASYEEYLKLDPEWWKCQEVDGKCQTGTW
jgi:tetratricopeptide (TPR) repeat protein